jgi:hypothetical protein
MLPYKIALPLTIGPRQMNGALALDVADHLRQPLFRSDRQQHLHMIQKHVPFLDPALPLKRELAKYLPQLRPQLTVLRLTPPLGNEHHVLFALPFRVI